MKFLNSILNIKLAVIPVLFIGLFIYSCQKQPPVSISCNGRFTKIFPVNNMEFYTDIVEDKDGNLLWLYSRNEMQPNEQVILCKADPCGNVIWQDSIPLPSRKCCTHKIMLQNDGSYVIIYNLQTPDPRVNDTYIATYTNNGALKGQVKLPNSFFNFNIIDLKDGTFMALDSNESGGFIERRNLNGTILSQIKPKSSSGHLIYSFDTANNHGAVTVGVYPDYNIPYLAYNYDFCRYAADGKLLFRKLIADSAFDYRNGVIIKTVSGGYLVYSCPDTINLDVVYTPCLRLSMLDSNGNIMWTKNYFANSASAFSNSSNEMSFTRDGSILALAYSQSNVVAAPVIHLLKTDAHGNNLWDHTYGGNSGTWPLKTIQLQNGDLLIAGITKSFGLGLGGESFYLIRTNANGEDH